MKLKTTLLFTICCLLKVLPIHGQIIGQLTDQAAQPLPYANVLLLAPNDSTLIRGVVTNDVGQFNMPSVAERYLLAFSMIGYQTRYVALNLEQDELDIGSFALSESSQTLGEVVVQSKKLLYEQQSDRVVVNVSSSIAAAGGNALDILSRSPGVAINAMNGSISLNGKEGVGVMINGKLSQMPVSAVVEMLRGMNGSTIENIELISNPPARYDAGNAGGLINIVMQQHEEYGTQGSLSLTGGHGYGVKSAGSLTLNHRRKRLNMFADYSVIRDRVFQLFTIARTISDPEHAAYSHMESQRDAYYFNQTARFGLDVYLSPHTTLGSQVSGYNNKWKMDALNQTLIWNPVDTSHIRVENQELNRWQHLLTNLNLTHTFGNEGVFQADFDKLWYYNNNPSEFPNEFVTDQGEVLESQPASIQKTTPIAFTVIKADYLHPVNNHIDFEIGLKGSASTFVNNVQYQYLENDELVTDPDITQRHRLKENIAAAYTSMEYRLSTRTKTVIGVRYEYTNTDLSSETVSGIVDRQYGNFFPNLLFSHDLNLDQSFQLSYGRRINRPSFNALAPFVMFYDPTNFESGNVSIQPSLTNALKAQYRWKDYVLSLQYSHEDNAIALYQPHFNLVTNELAYYGENMDRIESLTFTAGLPLQLTSWFDMQHTVIATYQEIAANYLERPELIKNFNVRLNSVISLSLPHGLGFELSGYIQSPFQVGVYRQSEMGSFNVGVKKKFDRERGTLSLTWNNLFWSENHRWDYDRPNQNIDTDEMFSLAEPRIFKMTYSRNFGNTKVKPNSRRNTGSEDERNRVN